MDPIESALAELAKDATTPAHVAGRLSQFDCKGMKRSTCSCPVATYLQKAVANKYVRVGQSAQIGGSSFYDIPEVVKEFIRAFDDGAYPELEFHYR